MKTVTRRSDRKLYNAEFDGDQWWVEGNGTRGYYTPEDFETFFEPADAPSEIEALRREVKALGRMVSNMADDIADNSDWCKRIEAKEECGDENTYDCSHDRVDCVIEEYRAQAQAEAEIAKEGKE